MSSFPLRPRGAHMPEHIRRLDSIVAGAVSASIRPLEPPQFRRDFLSSRSPANDQAADFAPVFANLTVWTDAAVHSAVHHVGHAKMQLYAAFLSSVVDELLPAERLRRHVDQLQAYLAYLSSDSEDADAASEGQEHGDAATARKKASPSAAHVSYVHVKMPPVERGRPMAALLSPRAVRAIRQGTTATAGIKHETADAKAPIGQQERAKLSGKNAFKSVKLVELSDHEEAVLELALFFQESLPSLTTGDQPARKITTPDLFSPTTPPRSPSRPAAALLSPRAGAATPMKPSQTERWLLLTADDKRETLQRIKRKLARHEFFDSSPSTHPRNTSQHEPSYGAACHESLVGGVKPRSPERPAPRPSKLMLSPYFSLVVLCLHETIRRVGGFSQELAQFAWKVLCEDTTAHFEEMFADVAAQQARTQQELQVLQDSKASLCREIKRVETEIQRLQSQNMRSLGVWNLESEEMGHLEHEEQWHGHCKALILSCLRQLQASVNVTTWLLLPSGPSSVVEGEDIIPTRALAAAERNPSGDGDLEDSSSSHLIQAHDEEEDKVQDRTVGYQKLAAGAALFHSNMRVQLVYIAHLLVLCRSFVHLHERRAIREVMDSTALEQPSRDQGGAIDRADTNHREQQLGSPPRSSVGTVDAAAATNPLQKTSLSELHTLREVNEALRAVEVLYAETGAIHGESMANVAETGNWNNASREIRRLPCQHRSVGTQFPAAGDPTAARAFLRSLAYCTMVVTSLSSKVVFLPAGAVASVPDVVGEASEPPGQTEDRMGSGRRRGSVSFRANESAGVSPEQPLLRLHKAMKKLPKHMKDLLLLPVLESEPFPADSPFAVAPSLSKDELLQKIHAIYTLVIENAHATESFSISLANPCLQGSGSLRATNPPQSWTSEAFVEFIYADFLEAAGGDIYSGERAFLCFFSSIQLLLSRRTSSSDGSARSIGAAASATLYGANGTSTVANEAIQFFAVLTKNHCGTGAPCSQMHNRTFAVFFYCQRVLLRIMIEKKRFQGGLGLGTDIWVLVPEGAGHGTGSTTRFVLLDSVKVLLLYLVPSLSSSASATSEAERAADLEGHLRLLEERAVLATVSLMTPVTPGPYHSTPGSHATDPSCGHLTETRVLPMDVAAILLVRAWMAQQALIESKLAIAFQAANTEDDGRVSFAEFAHVLTTGSGQSPPNAVVGSAYSSPFGSAAARNLLPPARLAQMYAMAKACDDTAGGSRGQTCSGLQGVRWQQLVWAVTEELDFLGVEERVANVDMRAIQHALVARDGLHSSHVRQLLAWLLVPPPRVGTAAALRKTWRLHCKAMSESFAVAMHSTANALEGVRCGQSGRLRYGKVQRMLVSAGDAAVIPATKAAGRRDHSRDDTSAVGSPNATPATPTGEAPTTRSSSTTRTDTQEDGQSLEVSWKAYYYLRLDYTQAHRFAEEARPKQQQKQ
ncbi:hypothetical protein BBJ28_00001162 [Nothophytophthora sp. Chile5]|nr:hypothetical protein BBJ28_00001162 [Nothophytophthora sp. Chile5]